METRRIDQKRGETQKMRGGGGKLLEKCGESEKGEGKRGKCEKR